MKVQLYWLAVLVVAVDCTAVQGRDWFVQAEFVGGDGTKAKPFKDPWQAMEQIEPGDVIHVAGGVYHGKFKCGNWSIGTPNLTWLGGYNESFTQRDPWRLPSHLRFSKEFRGKNSGTLIEGSGPHDHFVLDGFVLDQKEINVYEANGSLSPMDSASDPMIKLSGNGIEIRNCVLVNGAEGGIELWAAGGTRVVNNLLLNIYGDAMINSHSIGSEAERVLVMGNTFMFATGDRSRAGTGISFWSGDRQFELVDNLFVGIEKHAIFAGMADRLSLKSNVFWLNGAYNVKVNVKGQGGMLEVDNARLADLEDAGLRACQGNAAINPELSGLDRPWMEKFFAYAAANYPKLSLEELNQARASVGLAPVTDKGTAAQSIRAAAYDADQAVKIHSAALKQGAHPVGLDVPPFPDLSKVVAPQYEPATWQKLAESPRSLAGKRVEILGALGAGVEVFGFEGITEREYSAIEFRDIRERLGEPLTVFVKKGGKTERSLKYLIPWDGNGSPEEKHLIRGLVKYDPASKQRRKGAVVVEDISATAEQLPPKRDFRPSGRDWFVRANSSGDGSRNTPFKDPWQALEAAQPGDTIHVATGEYFGRFNSSHWKVEKPHLALIGGYDKDFSKRDPWNLPTRLACSSDRASRSSNPFIEGDDDHSGFILDGFVLDGRNIDSRDEKGNLTSRFPGTELVVLGSSNAIIRNCILLNSGGPALRCWADNTRIENNIILNCNYYSIDISTVPPSPFIIKSNTILFTWHAHRDKGLSTAGTAIRTFHGTRFELEGNIFGFADNQPIYTSGYPKRLKIVDNVFTRNRFANFTDGDKIVLDDKNLSEIEQLGLAAAKGNVVLDPEFRFEKQWWADYNSEEGHFFARPYDWREACQLFPHNPSCKAGARPLKLEVHFRE